MQRGIGGESGSSGIPRRALFLAATLIGVLLSGCTPAELVNDEEGAVYTVRGQLIRIIADGSGIRCAHEEIPGLMGAMRMDFQVAPDEEISKLRPGDKIRFHYRVTDLGGYAYDIEKLPDDTRLDLPEELRFHPALPSSSEAS